ncbi:hypothetical protein SAMN04488029_1841 [Reichenbachiella faecimaris]|uniref:ABC transporter ATPase n=1 Tax=Reichenbachiella faecimaris TaxID=692418 RepID=A0A1W2GBW0_REIFA|nr:hypothetical protein [Reichenbachiella faecimaris]SMD34113.1 hypothetical protein SAMN04488029_1841 [Reichenbachiella faecimaris]
MYIPFDEMVDTSRVWIYQANRHLSSSDQALIDIRCNAFLQQWAAHGQSLKSSFQVIHDKFLIISVDESFNQASGCSIDASVALIKNLEQELDINFFDRTQVCFLINDEIVEIPMTKIKSQVESGTIQSDTLTFNHLVTDIKSFNTDWKVAAKNSWLKRYFQ